MVTETVDVAVVGGGLAGLAAAASAADCGATVIVVDRDERGGRAATEIVGRFRFNRGGHGLYRGGPGAEVLRRFGVRPTGAKPSIRGQMWRLGDEAAPALRSGFLGRRATRQIARCRQRLNTDPLSPVEN